MSKSKLRLQIAQEAAQLMYQRQEAEYRRARTEAIDRLALGEVGPEHLPSNTEIRIQIRKLASIDQAEQSTGSFPLMCITAGGAEVDRFEIYTALLIPLENTRQHLKYHPEGDALYHSLQVFDHARDELPYDEDFLTAALLHDVGKGIDMQDHVAAGLEALEGCITERTHWLIEHHMLAHAIADRSIGSRAHRRLRESEYYEDLVLLGECDRAGRQPGVEAPELEEAIDYLRELSQMFG